MSNNEYDDYSNNKQDWQEEDTGIFGNRAMSPEARNILKYLDSVDITRKEPEMATVQNVVTHAQSDSF